MNNLFTYLLIIFMALLGGDSTVFVVLALPVTIIYKIYRKVKYKENIM